MKDDFSIVAILLFRASMDYIFAENFCFFNTHLYIHSYRLPRFPRKCIKILELVMDMLLLDNRVTPVMYAILLGLILRYVNFGSIFLCA